MAKKQSLFSKIPAVDKVLQHLKDNESNLPLPLVTELVRNKIESLREYLKNGGDSIGEFEEIVAEIRAEIFALNQSRIHPVINGTGVIIHTNLGRSPLSPRVVERIADVGRYYNNIELDLNTGERGIRGGFLEVAMANLIEAEAATVSNNCAAALILILKHLANGERNEVIISRGELVEIGGGFRVPEIMEVSGAKLVEIGATNKTSVEDYENAITDKTGLILKVHRSNFYIEGFVHEPATEELVELGKKHGIPVAEDLGSGAMLPTDSLAPIPHEPTATEVLNRGVDLVCVSGDKLFGGPQAGIIAGRADLVAGIKKEPFFRALRCDKMILTGLQETVVEYLNQRGGGEAELPLVQKLSLELADLTPRAEKILKELGNDDQISIGEGLARCGGGTMPKAEMPSITIDIKPANMSLKKFAAQLRQLELPMVGYISDDKYRLDLRTIMIEQDSKVIANLKQVLNIN